MGNGASSAATGRPPAAIVARLGGVGAGRLLLAIYGVLRLPKLSVVNLRYS